MEHRLEEKLETLTERVTELEKSRISTELLLNQLIETNKEFTITMRNVERTMIGIQNSLENTGEKMVALNIKVDKVDNRVEKLDSKVNDEVENNKIDFRTTMKNGITEFMNLTWKILFGLGASYGVYEIFKDVTEKFGGK